MSSPKLTSLQDFGIRHYSYYENPPVYADHLLKALQWPRDAAEPYTRPEPVGAYERRLLDMRICPMLTQIYINGLNLDSRVLRGLVESRARRLDDDDDDDDATDGLQHHLEKVDIQWQECLTDEPLDCTEAAYGIIHLRWLDEMQEKGV